MALIVRVLEPGERCDDGNDADGDGCDSNCTPTGCGNGVVTAGEDCDDGNNVDGDGCASDCTDEPDPVPAVSHRGLLALVMLLLGTSAAALWRRRLKPRGISPLSRVGQSS